MRKWFVCRLLLLWPLLLSCEQQSGSQARPPAGPHSAGPAQPTTPPGQPFAGYRRYRGTVGKLPVTVELTIEPADAGDSVRCTGYYYYDRAGGALLLQARMPWRPSQPLALTEMVARPDGAAAPATAHWQATQPAGPVLSGVWTSATGRQLPFALREDYAGAVRYELLPEAADGEACPGDGPEGSPSQRLRVAENFLHLLGPDTLRPGLRHLQCPVPAQRRAQLRAQLEELSCAEERYGTGTYREVTYNANGLLSLVQTDDESSGGPYPAGTNTAYTYDLATGKHCDVRDWLRPNKAAAVAALFARALRADSTGRHYAAVSAAAAGKITKLADLPAFGLSSEGLFETLGNLGAPHAVQRLPITIAYAQLGPYVRPNTPLARLLQARGLLRP